MSHWEDPFDVFIANIWQNYSTPILWFFIVFLLAHPIFWVFMERKLGRTESIYDFSNQTLEE